MPPRFKRHLSVMRLVCQFLRQAKKPVCWSSLYKWIHFAYKVNIFVWIIHLSSKKSFLNFRFNLLTSFVLLIVNPRLELENEIVDWRQQCWVEFFAEWEATTYFTIMQFLMIMLYTSVGQPKCHGALGCKKSSQDTEIFIFAIVFELFNVSVPRMKYVFTRVPGLWKGCPTLLYTYSSLIISLPLICDLAFKFL